MTTEHTPITETATSETIRAAAPTAGVLRRFAAIVYDFLLLLAISIAYGGLVTLINVTLQGQPPAGEKVQWGQWGIAVFIGWILVLLSFFCYFWRKSGQTLGMRAWRMKLVSEDLSAPSIKQCLVRCSVAIPSLFLMGAGYFWRWFDPQKLTLQDRISKTKVLVLPKDKK